MRMSKWFQTAFVTFVLVGACSFGQVWATPSWHQATGIGSTVDLVEGSSNVIYGVVQGTGAGIYKSTDGGANFSSVKSFTTPYMVDNGCGNGVLLWAATSAGLYHTADLSTWTLTSGGLPSGGGVTMVASTASNATSGCTMWATVTGVTTRGLYRSTDQGSNWSRVIVKAATNAVSQGFGCGTSMSDTVFAGGALSLGGPSCTLLKSTDGGSTFSCTSYSKTVNDLLIDCFSGSTQGHLYITIADPATAAGSVVHSPDQGSTFSDDGSGLGDIGASNIHDDSAVGADTYQDGDVVGGYLTGMYSRANDTQGTTWSQMTTTGLTDQHIKHWINYSLNGTFKWYVVATPSGVFYLN